MGNRIYTYPLDGQLVPMAEKFRSIEEKSLTQARPIFRRFLNFRRAAM